MRRRDYMVCRMNGVGWLCIRLFLQAWEIVALAGESSPAPHLRAARRWGYAAGGQNT